MPDKLTDSEIVKALECCISQPQELCCNCPIDIREIKGGCITALMTYALDLINRLQKENERLENAYKQCAWERDCFEADNKRLYEIIENKNIKTEEQ